MQNEENTIPEMTVQQLKEKLDQKASINVIDVREPDEYEDGHLNVSELIPLGDLEDRLSELDVNKDYVIHCRSGGRSARAVALLKDKGFKQVHNLSGGILAWTDDVDSTLSEY